MGAENHMKFHLPAMAVMAVLAMLGGCADAGKQKIETSPGGAAVSGSRTEPVNYNGRMYRVTFRQKSGPGHYEVTVAAPGRKLGGTDGDRRIVEQIAVSTVRHFNCRDGHHARIVPGSQKHEKGRWIMQAKCGSA